MTRFFRHNQGIGIAACCAVLALGTACEKKVSASAEAKTPDDAASVAPPPAPTTSASASTEQAPTQKSSPTVVVLTANYGTGLYPIVPNSTVDLPYRSTVTIQPSVSALTDVDVAGPFTLMSTPSGVVGKFDPSAGQLEELEKGTKLDATFKLHGVEYPFKVGLLQ